MLPKKKNNRNSKNLVRNITSGCNVSLGPWPRRKSIGRGHLLITEEIHKPSASLAEQLGLCYTLIYLLYQKLYYLNKIYTSGKFTRYSWSFITYNDGQQYIKHTNYNEYPVCIYLALSHAVTEFWKFRLDILWEEFVLRVFSFHSHFLIY